MNKTNALKIVKLSLGSSLAIFIAWLLKLEYSTVAGVITLLTVKNTKKETLKGTLGKIMVLLSARYFHIYVLILLGIIYILSQFTFL